VLYAGGEEGNKQQSEEEQMGNFINAIQVGNAYYCITDKVLMSKAGKKLSATEPNKGIWGHDDIRIHYGISKRIGRNLEFSNFSSPVNFPCEIADALQAGRITYGMPPYPALMLSEKALDKHDDILKVAWEQFERTSRTAFWELFSKPKNRNENWR
jgi:hypothetical protein